MHNKLGFYSDKTSLELENVIKNIKPLVITNHAGDNTFWRRVRQEWNPEVFLIGRIVKTPYEQDRLFKHKEADPVAGAEQFAREVMDNEAFKLETEDGRPIFDAWMALNEAVRGPGHFKTAQEKQEMREIYRRYDTFQVVFAEKLRAAGVEAVGMNFGAGNFDDGRVWLEHFPGTLETYKYLGFHEYGWPMMWRDDSVPNSATGCLLYRQVMQPIRDKYGNKHQVIITECGLARMYVHKDDGVGDKGWRYPRRETPSVREEDYWRYLKWYNEELNQDPYVLGACIFQVGHGPDWETFEILDSPIMGWLEELVGQLEKPEEPVVVTPTTPAEHPPAEAQLEAFRQEALAHLAALEHKADELQALLRAYRHFLRGR